MHIQKFRCDENGFELESIIEDRPPYVYNLYKDKEKIKREDVYCGRPSIYGNPFPIKTKKELLKDKKDPLLEREKIITKYENYVLNNRELLLLIIVNPEFYRYRL